jgi:hypothetical protein
MKKIYIFSLLIFAIVKAGFAQTPQNNLITWDMSQWQPGLLGYENPKGWVSGNLLGLDTVAKKVSGIGSGFAALLQGIYQILAHKLMVKFQISME